MLFVFHYYHSFITILLSMLKIQTPLNYIQDGFILIFLINTKFLFKLRFLIHFLRSIALFHLPQFHYCFLNGILN